MNNKELVSVLAGQNNISQAQAANILEQTVDSLLGALRQDTAVTLTNLGTFDLRLKQERVVVNPRSGQRQLVPPRMSLGFKSSKNCLKLQSNGEQ